MGYRNGIYVAFNGCGTTNPTDSDIKYFNMLKAWKENKNINFSFVDSHQKTYRVLDSSTKNTLISRLNERMSNSKLMFLIATDRTKNSSDIVDHEIIRAIDYDKIPIVVAFTDKDIIKKVSLDMKDKLPKSLRDRVEKNKCKILLIPYKVNAVKKAFEDFGVNEIKERENAIYTYIDVDSWN